MATIDKRNASRSVDEWGHGEADLIYGSRFDDTLRGAQGNDVIAGGGGNDVILDEVRVWTGNPVFRSSVRNLDGSKNLAIHPRF
jgi:Ca2+-binding RTX toxin-like protein